MKKFVGILSVFLLFTACQTALEDPAESENVSEAAEAPRTETATETPAGPNAEEEFTPVLSVEVLAEGLSHPWDLVETEPGSYLFTQRPGILSRLKQGRVTTVAAVPDVAARGEGGLTAITVDTNFSENRYLYLAYNTNKNGSPEVVITRFVLTESDELKDGIDIVTGIPAIESGRHSGARMAMGKDGVLWITTGDAATGTTPQDPQSLGGKVLRINGDGEPVEGNLEAPFDPRIFSYGHRNVQGLVLFDEPLDGNYGYTAEHGPSVDDEINRLIPGNFGWDPNPPYDESVPMTDLEAYPDAIEALWSSGDRTVAASDLAILAGSEWGAYENCLALTTLKDQKLMLIHPDQPEAPLVFLENEYGRLRASYLGSDGNLYLTTDHKTGGQILRIVPRR